MQKNASPKMAVADFFLKLQIFYLNLSNFLVYLAPALLLFTFHLTMQTIRQQYLIDVFAITDATGFGSVIYNTFVNIMDFFYAVMFFGVVFLSIHLTHGNKRYIYYVYFFSTMYGLFSLLTFIVILVDIAKGFSGLDSCKYLVIFSYRKLVSEKTRRGSNRCRGIYRSYEILYPLVDVVLYLPLGTLWYLLLQSQIFVGDSHRYFFFLVLLSFLS